MAPLSAALANGDDTLSITADCYSTAGTDAAITAALLAYYTSSQVDTLLGDYRTGAAQDAETTSAITAALLAYYTAAQVDALLGDYRTASAQDTQTQAAITGALLAYRTGPDQDVFTTNQITSALAAYRSAADQDTATASSIAAALLSYYTITQVDGLLANKLGVTEAASALQIAVRFPDDGGADEVVAAIGEQILAPTDVSLSNWTVRPSSGCSVVLATHTAGVSVDGYTLTLAANPWNIVRTYNLTPGRELLFACRYRLGTASNFVVYMSEADNVYDPLYGSFVGDQGAWSTAKMYFTVPPNGVAKLHFGAHFQAPGLPNQTAGTVDVYGLQILDATLEAGNTAEEEDTAASALLLKHEFLDGGADDATLGEVLLEPTLTTLATGSVASASLTLEGFQLEGYAMTLSAFACAPTPWRRGDATLSAAGTGWARPQPGDVRQRGRQRLRGRHRHLPRHALAGSLEHGAPGLLGAAGRNREAALRSLRRVYPRPGAAVGGHAGPVQHADQGQRLRGRLGLRDGPAGRLAGPHALGHSGRTHCARQRGLRPAAVQRRELHGDASGAVSCAALTATGTVAGATLTSTGAVSGSSLSVSGAASVGLLSSATGITGSTLTINNTANAGNFTTVGDVSTGTLTASGAATAASFAATGAVTGATLTITGAASAGPLDCESLDCTFTATSGGVSTGSVVCGDATSSGTVSAPQLFASNTLTVTNTSDFSDDLFLTKNWAGWSKLQVSNNSAAPDSGPELRLLGNQSARVFLERDGGTHQCELIMINDEALVQTKIFSTQLSLTTNQRNPGCLVIAGNTGNVVCNTSFTDLSDSRVKTEIAEADVAELLQLFDSVEAKQYKRPDMNGDLRLGFASDDFAGTKWKNLTGTTRGATARRWSPSTTLTSPACCGGCARASRPGWTRRRPGRPSGGRRTSKHGGAEGPGRRLQREGPAEAVPTRKAARPRRDAGHGLRGAEGRRGPAGAGWASRPPRGRTTGCRPTSSTSARTRGKTEQERRDGGPGHQARTAGADGGRRELRGHDRPGQRVRHAGPGAARGGRAPDEAARGPQRHCRGGPGHPDAEEGPGHARGPQGATTFSRPIWPTTRGPTRRCTAPRKTWRSSRPRSSGSSNRIKAVEDAGAFRAPTNAATVRRRAAAAGRGLHDRPEHRGPGDPAEAGAAGAPEQRQRSGPTDEAGQAGSCQAAGRLPGASKAQGPRLITATLDQTGNFA